MREFFHPGLPLVCIWALAHGPHGTHRLLLSVDTGATRSLITPQAMRRLGYDRSMETRRVIVSTPGGDVEAPLYRIERIDACGVQRSQIEVSSQVFTPRLPIDGFLGLDFFSERRLTIDLIERYIEVR